MTTKARVEFVTLGLGFDADTRAPNVIKTIEGTATALSVTGTATTAGSRPVAPTFTAQNLNNQMYARVTAFDGNIIAAVGADPTASATNGIGIPSGGVELFPISAGEKVSLIEVA